MTEKRFTKGYHTIRDIKENKTYDFRVDNICGLLNELDEKWIDEFSLRETLQQELQRVEEENKQLKQEIKGFESCSHNWGLLYDEAKNKVEELGKENWELKQKIKNIK